MITFTGSTEVGRKLQDLLQNLTKCTVELGGKVHWLF